MSSYYDDEEFGPIMRERDEEALIDYLEEREEEEFLKATRKKYFPYGDDFDVTPGAW